MTTGARTQMKTFERHFLLCCYLLAVSFFWGGALVAIYSLQEVERYLSAESFSLLSTSILSVIVAYFVGRRLHKDNRLPGAVNRSHQAVYKLAKIAFYALSAPALILAVQRFVSQSGVDYLDMESASPVGQAFLYGALYAYFVCLALSNKSSVSPKEFFLMFALVMIPRLLVGSISGRFVAVMPVLAFLFVGFARGYIQLRLRFLVAIVASASYLLFVHPLLRAGEEVGADSDTVMQVLLRSGPVNLMEQLDDVSKSFAHVNFLKTGLLGNVFPGVLSANEREDLWKREGLAVTADRAFAIHEGAGFEEMFGPGSIYVGELYLIGGWTSVVIGSLILGLTMGVAQKMVAVPTLWLVPLLDFAVKVPFVPRSNMTYMYERMIPLVGFIMLLSLTAFLLLKVSELVRARFRQQPFNT